MWYNNILSMGRNVTLPILELSIPQLSMLTLLTITFGQGQGVACKPDGTVVLAGKNVNGMYLLNTANVQAYTSQTLAMNSLSRPTSLEQWHWRLAHCSLTTIQEMASRNLVNSLNISDLTMSRKCTDCILG
jgi:hypothetical protein